MQRNREKNAKKMQKIELQKKRGKKLGRKQCGNQRINSAEKSAEHKKHHRPIGNKIVKTMENIIYKREETRKNMEKTHWRKEGKRWKKGQT